MDLRFSDFWISDFRFSCSDYLPPKNLPYAPRPAQTHELGPCKFHLRLDFWKVESGADAFRIVLKPLKIDSTRGAAEHPNIAKPPAHLFYILLSAATKQPCRIRT
jgi:hypothetical protein